MPMESPPLPVNPFPFIEDHLPSPNEDQGVKKTIAFYRGLLQQQCPALRFKNGAAARYQKDGHTFILAFDNASASVALSAPAEWAAESSLLFSSADDLPSFSDSVIAIRDEILKTRQWASDLSLGSEGPPFLPLSGALPPFLTVSVFPCEIPSPEFEDINVLALVKGTERFVFLYTDANRAKALRVLGKYASDPEINFSWYDAAVLSQKIRSESTKISYQKMYPWAPPPVLRSKAL
ncbi:MAG: hypothetical protein V1876_00600 [Candidatus Peregrinibacteria bacterium]